MHKYFTSAHDPQTKVTMLGRDNPAARSWGSVPLGIALLLGMALTCGAADNFRHDRILVKPNAGVSLTAMTNLHARLGGRLLRHFPRIRDWEVVGINANANVNGLLTAYRASGLVAVAEPDYIIHIAAEPNDPQFANGNQWNLFNYGQYGITPGIDISATNGWEIQTSARGLIIGIIDTGMRYTHEDLAPNLWSNPQVNQDGYTNDFFGINLVANGRGNGDPWDDHGHGTHVSGIIGAKGNNGLGIAGVCWDAQLMALKFINTNGDGDIGDAITCMDYAASHGAKIINASWGAYWAGSTALFDGINMLRDQEIIFVAAAGNSTNSNDGPLAVYPATYSTSLDNVIAVAATDINDKLAYFSNYGQNSVQLAAPGDPIISCWNRSDSDYESDYGTSMAAPQVAGACALVWSKYPNLTALQVIHQVVNGVDVLSSLAGDCITSGRLNLYKALAAPTAEPIPPAAVWVDDGLPAGAQAGPAHTNYYNDGSIAWVDEPWTWVTGNPGPYSGTAGHQSMTMDGPHNHYFTNATQTLAVEPGDTLFAYVYLDPTYTPKEIMLQWSDNCWEHRAFWGVDDIARGTPGTSGHVNMGPLPPAGQWVRLAVPASALKLEGATLNGMSFVTDNGLATWDYAGRVGPAANTTPLVVSVTAPANNATVSGTVTVSADASEDGGAVARVQFQLDGANLGAVATVAPYAVDWDSTQTGDGPHTLTAVATDAAGNLATSDPVSITVSNAANPPVVWVDDAIPGGAIADDSAGDSWIWVTNNPAPYSGQLAHQSCLNPGTHYHYFYDATNTLAVGTGDVLFTYVYLNPQNPPSEVMLQWCDGNSWAHAAYWGASSIAMGTNGTASQYPVGPLPTVGQWVRLEVPASAVGLEGHMLSGMSFLLYDGQATWDYSGLVPASP